MARNTIGAACAALLLLTAAVPAGAAPVTLGSPLSATFTQTTTYSRATAANVVLPEPGSRVASPVAGVVRRWRVQGTGTFSLRVLHPNGDGTYTAGAASQPATGAGASTVTATTSLPIEAGDLIGIDHTDPNDQIGVAGVSGASYSFWLPALADGDTRGPSNTWPGELAFNADVVPAPAVSAIIPAAGPIGGGTRVGIVGTDLTGASAVMFGSQRAQSFTVDSDSSITAVAPPGAAGIVDVHVTTPSGTSTTNDGDRFVYLAAAAAAPPIALPAPQAPGVLAALVGAPRATASGVRLTVACGGPAGGSCALATRLVVFPPKGAKHARAASVDKAKKAKPTAITVGVRKAKIASGAKWTATVPLDRTGRRMLRRLGRLPVSVITVSTPSGGTPTALPAARVTIKRR